ALGSANELAAGAGAVALLIGRSGDARLDSVVSVAEPLLDRYRGDDESETRDSYDGRLVREEAYLPMASEVIEALGMHSDTRWSLTDPDGRLAAALAKRNRLGDVVSADVRSSLGDIGAAAPIAGLVPALDRPGPAAALAWGGGRATSIAVSVDETVPGAAAAAEALLSNGTPVHYAHVLRARGQLSATGESVEMAIPPGSAMFVRDQREVLGLLGARCVECDTVNLPPSVHPSCPGCGGDKFDVTELPLRGTVQTFVINQTMPAPFEAPLPLIVIDLDDGSRIQLQGGDDGAELAVGSPVELVLRRYTIERGVPIYGWKAIAQPPATAPSSGEGMP
ncbi:MAG: OB-fold domain-containing protein, partial [Microthrixaceae bacterium]